MATNEPDEQLSPLTALAPLARVGLNIRLTILLLGSLSLSSRDQTGAAIILLALMALTSAAPVILWRRWGNWIMHHPLAMALDLIVALGVVLVTPASVVGFGYAVSTAALAGILYGRIGGLILTTPLLAAILVRLGFEPWTEVVTRGALLALATVVGAALRELVIDLQRAREEARITSSELATVRERERLARELHDSVAKTIQGVNLTARALERVVSTPDQVTALSQQIARESVQAITEARALLDGLRLDDIRQPIHESVHDIVATFANLNGLDVAIETQPVQCGDDVRYEVVNILRESLRNIDEHAGATGVTVALEPVGDTGMRLSISDDGLGFDPAEVDPDRYGLCGMAERAENIGATMSLDAAPGRGTSITLTCTSVAVTT